MRHLLNCIRIAAVILIWAAVSFGGQYSSGWQGYARDHSQARMLTAIITMADQVDLRTLQDQLYAQHADRQAWHEAVARALQEKAATTQADLIAELDRMAADGIVEKYRPLWIGNIIIVTATPEVLDRIVGRSDVLQISPDYELEQSEPDSRGDGEPSITNVEPSLRAIHADQVWAMGYTGEGRLIGQIDTGVDGDHPALTDRWRGFDSRYADNPQWAWYDPVTNTDFPFDSGQHGTHVMGTICGLGGNGSDTIGVAFGADWISAGVIDRVSIPRTVQDALAAMQWLTDPDGDPGTVWDVPDVCCNAWGLSTQHGYPPCDETFWVAIDNCQAAGVVMIFSTGGGGPAPFSIVRPADRATTDVNSFAVGAVDSNDPNFPIASFSSRGPSNCTSDGSDTFKPEVVAPGINIRSCVPGNGYQIYSGTSMATAHVAGVVALIRQANPNLTSEQVLSILLDSADDLGNSGDDNSYGMGMINAFQAVNDALGIPWFGIIGGLVTDAVSGQPIDSALVSIPGTGYRSRSRSDGRYLLIVPVDTAWVIKAEKQTTYLPAFDTITAVLYDTVYQDFALEPKVPVILKASFGNPQNVSYRSFYFKGSWDSSGFYDAGWSAPLIEARDNGISPDSLANDGVYTVKAFLARDTVHTFSWAIYNENYGDERYRLQNGEDFRVDSYDSPNVPELEVNPCGLEHNYTITVEGDHGLYLDLAPGFNGHPQNWGNSVTLISGISYAFDFIVMRCIRLGYGPIIFTPPIDGEYDFIFDDRDDSYVVQLSDTENFPILLWAESGLDSHIPLVWQGRGWQSTELIYDDGILANAFYYNSNDNLMAEMFCPSSWPLFIDSVMVHVLTDGDPYWPWPDTSHDPIGVSIFLDDGLGYPQTNPVFYTEVAGLPGEWIRVDVPEIAVDQGNFWVAMNNLAGGGQEGLGLDAVTDYPANKWGRENGAWIVQDYFAGDQMIRARVFGTNAAKWMGYETSSAGIIPRDVPVGGNPSLMAAIGQPGVIKYSNGGSPVNRMAYHPRNGGINPPSISDTEVLAGYNLYRDIAPSPWDRRPGTRVNGGGQYIQQTYFDDWCRWNNTDSIQNDIRYYYQVSAVYDIGNGLLIEIGPSNQATAIARSHSCRYIVGDINSDSVFNGIDVTFMVQYFKGGQSPSYVCSCPPDNNWFVAGDVNGNCNFNGLDVTYSVRYFRGGASPIPCPDCPPVNRTSQKKISQGIR